TDQFEFELINNESPSSPSSPTNNPRKAQIKYIQNCAPVRDYLNELDDGSNEYKVCKQAFGNQTAISTINRHFEAFYPSEYAIIKQPSAMKGKFTSYWAHLNESSTISGLLDLCNKLSTFDIYERDQAINKLHELHKKYKLTEENNSLPPPTTTKATRILFRNLNHSHRADLNQCKIDKYLAEIETEAEPLLW
ncbi:18118_t:CDS:2, partial [Racocetra fulgida]